MCWKPWQWLVYWKALVDKYCLLLVTVYIHLLLLVLYLGPDPFPPNRHLFAILLHGAGILEKQLIYKVCDTSTSLLPFVTQYLRLSWQYFAKADTLMDFQGLQIGP